MSNKAKDISWVAAQMATIQKNKLSAKLSSLQSEYNDGINLAAPLSTDYLIGEPQRIPGFPFMAVIPEDADTHPADGEYRYEIEDITLTIAYIVSAEDSPTNVLHRLGRSLRGVQEVIEENNRLGNTDGTIIIAATFGKSIGPLLLGSDALVQEGQIRAVVTVAV